MALKISTSTEFAVNEVREFIYSATEYQGNHGIELTSSAYNTVLTLTNRGTLKFAAPATADRSSLILATVSGAWWDGVVRNYGSMSVTGGSVYLLWAGWTPQVINTGRMTADGTDVSLIQGDQVKDQGASYPSVDNSGDMIATGSNGAVGVRFTYASTIINSGKINATVLAGGKNDALALMVGDGSVIRNTGQIVAEDNDAGAARSTAIAFSGSDGPALIVNNGLIKADIAIKESNLPRDFTGYAVSRVENYKDIVGKVVLGLGDDTLINRGQIDGDVELGDQNDVYDGAGGHVTGVVRGGAGVDRFLAGTGSERFEGGAGDDTFAPGTGSAVFDGGAGVDTVDYSGRGSSVSVSLASASVQGGVQLLNVEAVIGSTYGDTLAGDDGDNVFQGGGGNDAIDGGAGRDTAVYLGASFEYSWTQGTDGSWTIRDLRAGAADGVDTLRNVELLKFSDKVLQFGIANAINGSAGNDYIRATSADDVIDGGAGVDTVEYRGASTDFTVTQNSDGSWAVKDLRSDHPEGLDFLRNIEQLKFSDKLLVIGSAPPNAINGTSGADYIYATNANDVIDGGAGVDTVEFRGASTDFSWSVGSDGAWTVKDLRSGSPEGTDILRNVEQLKFTDKLVVIVEPTPNVILGTSGSDNLYGTKGNDIIRGGASDDFIYGSDGDDTFDGGEGRDLATFITSQQGVRVDLAILGPQNTGEGLDTFVSIETLQGSAYNDVFYGDSGANVINGYYGNDQIDGRDGDDSIGGDGGNDIIHGGAGNDSLSGGSGDDAVYGDAGDDRIVLASERIGIDPGRDIIDGGDGTDTLSVVFTDFGVDINLGISAPQMIGPGIDLVVKNVENLYGWEFADHLTGDARDNVIGGYNGDDVIDGGAGVDTVDMRGSSSDYAVTWTVNGWQVADKRAYAASNQVGSSSIYDGVDLVRNVEFIRYYDKTVALGDGMTFVVGNILRDTASTGNAVASGLSARLGGGAMTAAQAVSELVTKAGATTSVATLAYEFFTGKIPGQAGIDYLVSPSGPNPNNLNSGYYQSFNLENRYINFAVNLGKNGEGKDAFTAKYGALTLFDAAKAAYKTIFGATPTDEKTHALIDSRADYFAYYGGDGPNGVGTKAAMVGWLLAEAQKADLGVMVRSNDAWLTDLADGSAPFAVDILDPAKGYYKADFIYGGA